MEDRDARVQPDRVQRIGDILIILVMGASLGIALGVFGAAYVVWVVQTFT